MSRSPDLYEVIGPKVSALVAKLIFGSVVGDVTGTTSEIIAHVFMETRDQRNAKRSLDDIADEIVSRLEPLFEISLDSNINPNAIADSVSDALNSVRDSQILFELDLDPTKLTTHIEEIYPIRKKRSFSQDEISLYERAISGASRSIISATNKIPTFELQNAQVTLGRLTGIRNNTAKILESVQLIERNVSEKVSDERVKKYEMDYRTSVVKKLDYLEIFGIDFPEELKGHSLSVAYVSLDLAKGSHTASENVPAERLLEEVERKEKRLLIRGDAGGGKSTLFRWAAIQAARGEIQDSQDFMASSDSRSDHDQLPNDRPAWVSRIPFLVPLRDCKNGKLPSPDEFPKYLANHLGAPPENWVVDRLREGRCIVFFDGVDEVPNADRNELRKQIISIIEAFHPDNYFLISTRPAAVPENWISNKGFRDATVNPMSDLDIEVFVKNWHVAVRQILEEHGMTEDTDSLSDRLNNVLKTSFPLKRLASTPLLCASICALHRARHSYLPEKPTEIFDALCQMLLHRRDEERGIDLSSFPEPYRRLSYDEKRIIVRNLAHYLVRNEISRTPKSDAVIQIAKCLRNFPDHDESNAGIVLDALVERSGMLRVAVPSEIDFIHNSFKEYLAAEALIDGGDINLLAGKALDASWQQIVLFAVATKTTDVATKLVKELLHPSEGSERGSVRARGIMALRCRSVALMLEEGLKNEIDDISKNLFPPRTMSEAQGLADGGNEVVEFLRYKKLRAREAAACIRALRLISTPKAIDALEEYRFDKRWTVIQELAAAINPIKIPVLVERWTTRGKERRRIRIPWDMKRRVSDLSPLEDFDDKFLGNINELDLGHTRVENLSPLKHLPNIHILKLSRTNIKDYRPLQHLKQLRVFETSYTDNDIDLTPLSNASHLLSIYIDGYNFPFEKTRDRCTLNSSLFSSCKELELLELSFINIDEGNISLEENNKLKSLSIVASDIQSIDGLKNLKNLRILNLHSNNLQDISPITNIKSLEYLGIMGNSIKSYDPILDCNDIRSIACGNLTKENIKILSSVEKLSELQIIVRGSLNNVEIDDVFLNIENICIRGKEIDNIRDEKVIEEFYMKNSFSDFPKLKTIIIGEFSLEVNNVSKSFKFNEDVKYTFQPSGYGALPYYRNIRHSIGEDISRKISDLY